MKKEELITLAFKAADNAYAPYSKFHVGAAVECKDGKVFIGANIENSSFGATVCAERNAIFAAYSNGYRKDDIIAMATVADTHGKLSYSCGLCRQVMGDLLNHDIPVYYANRDQNVTMTVNDIYPYPFGPEDF